MSKKAVKPLIYIVALFLLINLTIGGVAFAEKIVDNNKTTSSEPADKPITGDNQEGDTPAPKEEDDENITPAPDGDIIEVSPPSEDNKPEDDNLSEDEGQKEPDIPQEPEDVDEDEFLEDASQEFGDSLFESTMMALASAPEATTTVRLPSRGSLLNVDDYETGNYNMLAFQIAIKFVAPDLSGRSLEIKLPSGFRFAMIPEPQDIRGSAKISTPTYVAGEPQSMVIDFKDTGSAQVYQFNLIIAQDVPTLAKELTSGMAYEFIAIAAADSELSQTSTPLIIQPKKNETKWQLSAPDRAINNTATLLNNKLENSPSDSKISFIRTPYEAAGPGGIRDTNYGRSYMALPLYFTAQKEAGTILQSDLIFSLPLPVGCKPTANTKNTKVFFTSSDFKDTNDKFIRFEYTSTPIYDAAQNQLTISAIGFDEAVDVAAVDLKDGRKVTKAQILAGAGTWQFAVDTSLPYEDMKKNSPENEGKMAEAFVFANGDKNKISFSYQELNEPKSTDGGTVELKLSNEGNKNLDAPALTMTYSGNKMLSGHTTSVDQYFTFVRPDTKTSDTELANNYALHTNVVSELTFPEMARPNSFYLDRDKTYEITYVKTGAADPKLYNKSANIVKKVTFKYDTQWVKTESDIASGYTDNHPTVMGGDLLTCQTFTDAYAAKITITDPFFFNGDGYKGANTSYALLRCSLKPAKVDKDFLNSIEIASSIKSDQQLVAKTGTISVSIIAYVDNMWVGFNEKSSSSSSSTDLPPASGYKEHTEKFKPLQIKYNQKDLNSSSGFALNLSSYENTSPRSTNSRAYIELTGDILRVTDALIQKNVKTPMMDFTKATLFYQLSDGSGWQKIQLSSLLASTTSSTTISSSIDFTKLPGVKAEGGVYPTRILLPIQKDYKETQFSIINFCTNGVYPGTRTYNNLTPEQQDRLKNRETVAFSATARLLGYTEALDLQSDGSFNLDYDKPSVDVFPRYGYDKADTKYPISVTSDEFCLTIGNSDLNKTYEFKDNSTIAMPTMASKPSTPNTFWYYDRTELLQLRRSSTTGVGDTIPPMSYKHLIMDFGDSDPTLLALTKSITFSNETIRALTPLTSKFTKSDALVKVYYRTNKLPEGKYYVQGANNTPPIIDASMLYKDDYPFIKLENFTAIKNQKSEIQKDRIVCPLVPSMFEYITDIKIMLSPAASVYDVGLSSAYHGLSVSSPTIRTDYYIPTTSPATGDKIENHSQFEGKVKLLYTDLFFEGNPANQDDIKAQLGTHAFTEDYTNLSNPVYPYPKLTVTGANHSLVYGKDSGTGSNLVYPGGSIDMQDTFKYSLKNSLVPSTDQTADLYPTAALLPTLYYKIEPQFTYVPTRKIAEEDTEPGITVNGAPDPKGVNVTFTPAKSNDRFGVLKIQFTEDYNSGKWLTRDTDYQIKFKLRANDDIKLPDGAATASNDASVVVKADGATANIVPIQQVWTDFNYNSTLVPPQQAFALTVEDTAKGTDSDSVTDGLGQNIIGMSYTDTGILGASTVAGINGLATADNRSVADFSVSNKDKEITTPYGLFGLEFTVSLDGNDPGSAGGKPFEKGNGYVYIPLPKKGETVSHRDGSNAISSSKALEYGMLLNGQPEVDGLVGYEIAYTNSATPTMNLLPNSSGAVSEDADYYTSTPADLSKVTMIRLKLPDMSRNTMVTIKIPLALADHKTKVGDEVAFATGYCNFVSSNNWAYSSLIDGRKASASQLLTYTLKDFSISGTVWEDRNYNHLYDASVDKSENFGLEQSVLSGFTATDSEGHVYEYSKPSGSNYVKNYTINVPREGSYTVSAAQPKGYRMLFANRAGGSTTVQSKFTYDDKTGMYTAPAIVKGGDASYINFGCAKVISLNAPERLELAVGLEGNITTPTNPTYLPFNCNYSIADNNIAKITAAYIDIFNPTLTIKALKPGTTTLTTTLDDGWDGTLTKTTTIYVKAQKEPCSATAVPLYYVVGQYPTTEAYGSELLNSKTQNDFTIKSNTPIKAGSFRISSVIKDENPTKGFDMKNLPLNMPLDKSHVGSYTATYTFAGDENNDAFSFERKVYVLDIVDPDTGKSLDYAHYALQSNTPYVMAMPKAAIVMPDKTQKIITWDNVAEKDRTFDVSQPTSSGMLDATTLGIATFTTDLTSILGYQYPSKFYWFQAVVVNSPVEISGAQAVTTHPIGQGVSVLLGTDRDGLAYDVKGSFSKVTQATPYYHYNNGLFEVETQQTAVPIKAVKTQDLGQNPITTLRSEEPAAIGVTYSAAEDPLTNYVNATENKASQDVTFRFLRLPEITVENTVAHGDNGDKECITLPDSITWDQIIAKLNPTGHTTYDDDGKIDWSLTSPDPLRGESGAVYGPKTDSEGNVYLTFKAIDKYDQSVTKDVIVHLIPPPVITPGPTINMDVQATQPDLTQLLIKDSSVKDYSKDDAVLTTNNIAIADPDWYKKEGAYTVSYTYTEQGDVDKGFNRIATGTRLIKVNGPISITTNNSTYPIDDPTTPSNPALEGVTATQKIAGSNPGDPSISKTISVKVAKIYLTNGNTKKEVSETTMLKTPGYYTVDLVAGSSTAERNIVMYQKPVILANNITAKAGSLTEDTLNTALGKKASVMRTTKTLDLIDTSLHNFEQADIVISKIGTDNATAGSINAMLSTAGTYLLTLQVTDQYANPLLFNVSQEATCQVTVKIIADNAPQVAVTGQNWHVVEGDSIEDVFLNATVIDTANPDAPKVGDPDAYYLTKQDKTTNVTLSVALQTPGLYYITYVAYDDDGNEVAADTKEIKVDGKITIPTANPIRLNSTGRNYGTAESSIKGLYALYSSPTGNVNVDATAPQNYYSLAVGGEDVIFTALHPTPVYPGVIAGAGNRVATMTQRVQVDGQPNIYGVVPNQEVKISDNVTPLKNITAGYLSTTWDNIKGEYTTIKQAILPSKTGLFATMSGTQYYNTNSYRIKADGEIPVSYEANIVGITYLNAPISNARANSKYSTPRVIDYTVEWNASAGGTINDSAASKTATPGFAVERRGEPIANQGYTFTGWAVSNAISPALTGTFPTMAKPSTFDAPLTLVLPKLPENTNSAKVTFTAKFEAIPAGSYDVRFDLNNHGSKAQSDSTKLQQTVADGGHAKAPTVVPDINYNFLGWLVQGSISTTLIDNTNIDATAVHGNITYVAQYSTQHTVVFAFAANGKQLETEVGHINPNQTIIPPQKINTPTAVANSGYTFLGWKLDGAPDNTPLYQKVTIDKLEVKTSMKFIAQYKTDNTNPGGGGGGGTAPTPTPDDKRPQLNKDDHFAYMQGYPDLTFHQDGNMTRAEVTVMFARLLVEQMEVNTNYPSLYADVRTGAWYYKEVNYMGSLKLIEGYPDGTFRPDEPITRAEFATIASRFEELSAGADNSFSDVPQNYWAKAAINSAVKRGWVIGYPDGTFKPENNITRAEVVTVTNRMLERVADQGYITANQSSIRNYTDLQQTYWGYYDIAEASNGHDFEKKPSEIWTKLWGK